MKCLACILLLASGPCIAADDWTRSDWERQAAYTALLTVDYLQTRWITQDRSSDPANASPSASHRPHKFEATSNEPADDWIETNPLLGEHPSQITVSRYFLGSVLVNAGISAALPRTYRPYWQWASISFETVVIGRNAAVGVKLRF